METRMKPSPLMTACLFLAMGLSVMSGSLYGDARPDNLPESFRFIGIYQLNSKIRVENGAAMPVVISPVIYRVFSDGIDVRVYGRAGNEDSYTNYVIYRADGVGMARKSGEIDIVAGVQAYSTNGEMIRQVSVTRNSLTLVKMPPRSHRVLVTRAFVVKEASPASHDKAPTNQPTR